MLVLATRGSNKGYLIPWAEVTDQRFLNLPFPIQFPHPGFKSLFNVLSTKPNLNKLTVYTSLLTVRDGINTWMQDCKTPCTPW